MKQKKKYLDFFYLIVIKIIINALIFFFTAVHWYVYFNTSKDQPDTAQDNLKYTLALLKLLLLTWDYLKYTSLVATLFHTFLFALFPRTRYIFFNFRNSDHVHHYKNDLHMKQHFTDVLFFHL